MRNDYLNLGCGARWHPEWRNIDIEPAAPAVVAHDLSRGIPAPTRSCRVVYHSHLLEHLRPEDGRRFVDDCFRVLAPGGILRIATPDLERICRDYLAALDRVGRQIAGADDDAEWMRIELYDQTVRERSGGRMHHFLSGDVPNLSFVRSRIGAEADSILLDVTAPRTWRWPGFQRAIRFGIRQARRVAVLLVTGRSGLRAFDIGTFRLGGEVHQWLYDRHSLAALLVRAGFEEPRLESATTSRIADWTSFALDTDAAGTPFKPDSMYMEAVKPAVS